MAYADSVTCFDKKEVSRKYQVIAYTEYLFGINQIYDYNIHPEGLFYIFVVCKRKLCFWYLPF